jgi:hypothetical protein
MNIKEAQILGRTIVVKGTVLIVGILLIIFLIMSTISDFGNGILFFFEAILNIHFLAIMAILFGLTLLFGSSAGKEIILEKKNYILTSIKYVILIILAIIIYAGVVGVVKDKTNTPDNFERLITTYFLTPLVKTGSITIFPMLGVWLWATNLMQSKVAEEK